MRPNETEMMSSAFAALAAFERTDCEDRGAWEHAGDYALDMFKEALEARSAWATRAFLDDIDACALHDAERWDAVEDGAPELQALAAAFADRFFDKRMGIEQIRSTIPVLVWLCRYVATANELSWYAEGLDGIVNAAVNERPALTSALSPKFAESFDSDLRSRIASVRGEGASPENLADLRAACADRLGSYRALLPTTRLLVLMWVLDGALAENTPDAAVRP